MASDPTPFLPTCYVFIKVSGWTKLKTILEKNFKFIDDLNSVNDGGEIEANFCKFFGNELELGRENTDRRQDSFLDLDIKIEFRLVYLMKEIHFP